MSETAQTLVDSLVNKAHQAAMTSSTKCGWAIMEEGRDLPEPLPQQVIDDVAFLQAQGVNISISGHSRQRVIQLDGYRVNQAQVAAASRAE